MAYLFRSPEPRPVESAIVAPGEFNGDGIKDLAVIHAGVRRLSVSWVTEMDHFSGNSITPWLSNPHL